MYIYFYILSNFKHHSLVKRITDYGLAWLLHSDTNLQYFDVSNTITQ